MGEAHRELLSELERAALRRSSGIPLYLQAASALERWLHTHDIAPGHPLPSETDLARALGVSRPTLRQAVKHLVDRGLVHTQRGIGTFVSPQTMTRPLRMTSLYDDLVARGRTPTTRVLALASVPANDILATELGTTPGVPLLLVERLRLSDGVPVALVTNNLALPPGADLTAAELEAQGLYHLLDRKVGLRPVSGSQRLSARLASPREAELLHLDTPAALLSAYRVSTEANGRGIEVSTTLYTDATEIASSLRPG